MAKYLLDITHRPAFVVFVQADAVASTPDGVVAFDNMGQLYANQTGRSLVVAAGADPQSPTYVPVVPDAPLFTEVAKSGVELVPKAAVASPEHDLGFIRKQRDEVMGGLVVAPQVAVKAHSMVWDLLKSLEPTAISLLIQLLQTLAGGAKV